VPVSWFIQLNLSTNGLYKVTRLSTTIRGSDRVKMTVLYEGSFLKRNMMK